MQKVGGPKALGRWQTDRRQKTLETNVACSVYSGNRGVPLPGTSHSKESTDETCDRDFHPDGRFSRHVHGNRDPSASRGRGRTDTAMSAGKGRQP